MKLKERIAEKLSWAKRHRADPAVLATEVLLEELLRRLQPKLRGAVVWKGGTVLRLLGNPRYSRDLDATWDRERSSLTLAEIRKILKEVAQELTFLKKETLSSESNKHPSITQELVFQIPNLKIALKIAIEISTREPVLQRGEAISTARLSHSLGTTPVLLLRLSNSELLAEKLRALLIRQAPRDIPDLYFCLQQGMSFDKKLFLEKMALYPANKKIPSTEKLFADALLWLQKTTPDRLRRQLANYLPIETAKMDFEVILHDIHHSLTNWQKEISTEVK